MTNARIVRITKKTSSQLTNLKKITGIPKCRIIENALKNYVPFSKDEINKK
jgi:hypothetical protein